LSKREDFEPTTIAELLHESGDPKTRIRIFSSASQEYGILSVYSDDGVCILDVEKLDENKD